MIRLQNNWFWIVFFLSFSRHMLYKITKKVTRRSLFFFSLFFGKFFVTDSIISHRCVNRLLFWRKKIDRRLNDSELLTNFLDRISTKRFFFLCSTNTDYLFIYCCILANVRNKIHLRSDANFILVIRYHGTM